MPELIRPVDYYHVTVHDRPGEGYWIYTQLRQAGVRLIGSAAFPLPHGKAQLSLIPENPKAFLAAAEDCECELSGRKQAFLIQGEERLGALADIYGRLERAGISVVAAHAVSAGDGHWGMMLWVKPPDYERAGKALGV
jgi:hypothetical protein